MMNDLISRQAAIDAIRTKYCSSDFMEDGVIDAFAEIIQDLPSAQPERITMTEEERRMYKKLRTFHSGSYAKLLDKLFVSAQPEQQWISCKDRLPEYDGEMYLVTDYCEQINRRRIHVSYCYVNREGFWSDVPLGYKVLAWMPLPEPWRGYTDEKI